MDLDEKALQAARDAWADRAQQVYATRSWEGPDLVETAIKAYIAALPKPDGGLVEGLRKVQELTGNRCQHPTCLRKSIDKILVLLPSLLSRAEELELASDVDVGSKFGLEATIALAKKAGYLGGLTAGLSAGIYDDSARPTTREPGEAFERRKQPEAVWVRIEAFRGEPDTALLAWWWSESDNDGFSQELDDVLIDTEGKVCGKGGCGADSYSHIMLAGFDRPQAPDSRRRK